MALLFKLLFIKIQPKSKKRNDKESMTCLTLKPNQKNAKIIGVSLCPPSSPDLNLLDYTIWRILENRTNATSPSNIGSLKTAGTFVGDNAHARQNHSAYSRSCDIYKKKKEILEVKHKRKMTSLEARKIVGSYVAVGSNQTSNQENK